MSAFISESQSLRACNLPDTPHWRNWLREKLAPQEISTGRIYDRGLVDHLAEKIRPLAGPPAPEPVRAAAPEMRVSGAIDSGIRPKRSERPLENRNGPQLESR